MFFKHPERSRLTLQITFTKRLSIIAATAILHGYRFLNDAMAMRLMQRS